MGGAQAIILNCQWNQIVNDVENPVTDPAPGDGVTVPLHLLSSRALAGELRHRPHAR